MPVTMIYNKKSREKKSNKTSVKTDDETNEYYLMARKTHRV
ncbi:MAG: hypothetical protein ACFFCQ_01265 [Promethearchaeota archaeon]